MGRLFGRVAVMLALALVGAPLVAAAEPAAASPVQQAAAIPAPSCAEGPLREGEVIVGTDCADRIVVPPTVTYVDGGPGNDTIVGSLTTAASGSCASEPGCHQEAGSQTFEGGPGDDFVYGDRGNDILRGNAGDDRLYGGIGDDRLEGGSGNDWMSGGFGSDTIDGQEGNDYVRGDGTIDHIFDTGGGYDTLSFATGVTPGFTAAANPTGASNFPGPTGERGIYLEIGEPGPGETGIHAINGEPSDGGGNDEVERGVFERIVGTPFSDYIVGTGASEEILGGGGADAIKGGGGADVLRGGADGDYLNGGPGSTMFGEAGTDGCDGGGATPAGSGCENTAHAVTLRDDSKVSVGETAAGSPASGLNSVDVYLVGSAGTDSVTATYGSGVVSFQLGAGGGTFDAGAADAGGCTVGSATSATCPLPATTAPAPPLDAIVLAGMGGDDTITAAGLPDGSSVVELGGEGGDTLKGGPSEDVLVDGDGSGLDTLLGEAGDDALLHNGGPDTLDGGPGSDLFLSVSVCDGETIDGGTVVGGDRDNASWARLGNGGVAADLLTGEAGRVGSGETPACTSGSVDHLTGIEDLEGSEGSDVLVGDEGVNQLLGHKGADIYRALGGNDTIFANSGTVDKVIDCGAGEDSATIDLASVGDPPPIGCERVREGTAEEFRTEIEEPVPISVTPPPVTPPPLAPPPISPPKPKPDRTPPRTKVLRRPPAVVRVAPRQRAAVAFRFGASEGSHFECKLDAKPWRRCRSPLRAHLAIGRHAFRVFAIDAAGNRDKTPALVKVQVLARHR